MSRQPTLKQTRSPGAVLACRVSHDHRKRMTSVTQQEAELRAWCEAENWPVVTVLVENDRPASRFAPSRGDWLGDVANALDRPDADRLLTWEVSRASRDMDVSLALVNLCEAEGVRFGYDGRLYDLGRAHDRKHVLRDFVDAEAAAGETSERVRRDMRAAAAQGRPHGRRLYGYRRVYSADNGELEGQVPDPAEAEVVRDVFARFARGDSLRSITTHLNRSGVPCPKISGAQDGWYDMRLRQMLANPGYVGLRTHQGEVVGDASWVPLIDPETWAKVSERLTAQEGAPHSRAAKHLLSGLVRCGRCGGPMHRQVRPGGVAILKCTRERNLSRAYDPVEAIVLVALLAKLEAEDIGPPRDDPASVVARGQLTTLEAELAELEADRKAGRIKRASTYAIARDEVLDRIEAVRRRLRPRAGIPTAVLDLMGPGAAERWDELGLRPDGISRQREVLAAVFDITIKPGLRGSHVFDPDTVVIEPML